MVINVKATGIVRRIDDLGRVVIPKEIRRTLKIYEGCPLEIFTESDGSVIFKKYSGMEEFSAVASIYAETLSSICGQTCCICDTEKIIAAGGAGKKSFVGKNISDKLIQTVMMRKPLANPQPGIEIADGMDKTTSNLRPIITSGDILGAVFIVDSEKAFTETDMLRLTTELLARQGE